MKPSSQTIELIICQATDNIKPDAGNEVRDSEHQRPETKEPYPSRNRNSLSVTDADMVNNYSQFFVELS